jgi:hypothetical protein
MMYIEKLFLTFAARIVSLVAFTINFGIESAFAVNGISPIVNCRTIQGTLGYKIDSMRASP